MSTFSFPLILIVLNFDKARDERANGKQASEPAACLWPAGQGG